MHLDGMANKDMWKKHLISSSIDSFLSKLKKRPDLLVVHTDKPNTICIVKMMKYLILVRLHLNKEVIISNVDNILKVHKKVLSFIEENRDILSKIKFNYIKISINTKNSQ